MASTYSTNLKIELQATGENSGTWGTITNTNLGTALEQAIVGYGNPSYASDANLTLTYTDTNAAQAARALVLNVTSAVSLTGTRELVVPTIQKQYIVQNNTTGAQSITVKTSGGTGITVPNGRKAHLYVDGTNVIYMDDFVDINGGAIDGTTIGANSAAAGTFTTVGATTGNITTVNATTVDTTNVEVTNVKAKDGTAAIAIADSTGAVTVSSGSTLNGGVVINEPGADVDFRIEGDTDANLFFADASTDRIGIGTNAPTQKLTVAAAGKIEVLRSDNARGGQLFADSLGTHLVALAAGNDPLFLETLGSDGIRFLTSASEKMRLSGSGNLGLGVTPAGWTTYKAMQFSTTGAIAAASGGDMVVGNNYYYDGANKYLTTAPATYYYQYNGAHSWHNAPSGTAGTAATFTQAMTLDASGNLTLAKDKLFGISTSDGSDNGYLALCGASADGSARGGHIYLSGNERTGSTGTVAIAAGNVAGGFIEFRTGADVERARISAAGKFLVGTTTAVGAADVVTPRGFISRVATIPSTNGTVTVTVPDGCICVMSSGGYFGDSAIFAIKSAGGSQGCYVLSQGQAGAIGFGTTTDPNTGSRLDMWISATNTMSIQDVGQGGRDIELTFFSCS